MMNKFEDLIGIDPFRSQKQRGTGFDALSSLKQCKFDSALVSDVVTNFKRKVETSPNIVEVAIMINNFVSREDLLSASNGPHCFARCLKSILTGSPTKLSKKHQSLITNASRAANRATKVSMDFNVRSLLRENRWVDDYELIIRNMDNDIYLNRIKAASAEGFELERHIKSFFQRQHKKLKKSELLKQLKSKNCFFGNHLGFNFAIYNGSVCYIRTQFENFLLPYDYLSMIHNKCFELLSISLSSHFLCAQTLCPNFPQQLFWFILRLIEIMILEKNRFFDLAVGLESILIANVIKKHEKWHNDVFWRNVNDNILTSIANFPLAMELLSFLESLPDPAVSELVCLSKILGHPIISTEEALLKLSKRAFNDPNSLVDLKLIDQLHQMIVLEILDRHIDRHKVWPKCTFKRNCPTAVITAKQNGWKLTSRAFRKEYGYDPKSLTDYIELLPSEDFPKPQSMIETLKDRAISVIQSSVIKYYLQSHFVNESDDDDIDRHERWLEKKRDERLMLTFLLSEDPDSEFNKFLEFMTHRKYHEDYYDKNGQLIRNEWLTPTAEYMDPDELLDQLKGDMSIKLTIKERELKTSGRLFGALPMLARACNQVMENNLAQWVTRNASYQTLKMSESDLLRKLHSFVVQKQLFKDYQFYIISFDAKGWCGRWRHTVVSGAMGAFDEIFGVECFKERMKLFENSLFYINSPDGTYVWDGQAGGIEGLAQYTWTVVYYQQSKLATEQYCDFSRTLIKGDDLRIALLVHKRQMGNMTPSEYGSFIMEKFSQKMKDMGHTIKVEESYCSSRILVFSRQVHIDDVLLPSSLRKASKIQGIQDVMIDTLEDKIASVFSNAHSSCPLTYNPIGLYYTACFLSSLYINNEHQFENITDAQRVALLLIPGVLGGFPVLMLSNMLVREESDHLTTALELYKFLVHHHSDLSDIFCSFVQSPPRELVPSVYKNLLTDPYSVNSTLPIGAMVSLRLSLSSVLPRLTCNKQILELHRLQSIINDDVFIESLLTGSVWHAKVFSLIHMILPSGILGNLIRQFETSKSIYQTLEALMGRRYANRILYKAMLCDRKKNQWRYERLISKTLVPYYEKLLPIEAIKYCSTFLADYLRESSWKIKIISITHPSPNHFIEVIPDSFRQQGDRSSSFEVVLHRKLEEIFPGSDLYISRTDASAPFFGSTTSKKLEQRNPLSALSVANRFEIALKTMLEVLAYTSHMSGVTEKNTVMVIVLKILDLYIENGSDIVKPYMVQVLSGCIDHRLSGPKYKRDVQNNVLQNIFNRFDFNSNSHEYLRGSSNNYSINVLGLFSYAVCMAHMDLQFHRRLKYNENFLIRTLTPQECPYCWMPIKDYPIDFTLTPNLENSLDYCVFTTTLHELYLVQETVKAFYSAQHEFFASTSGRSIARQNIRALPRNQLESSCARAMLDFYLNAICRTQELATDLTNQRIGSIGLEILDPLLNVISNKRFLHVRHWRRINYNEIVASMINMVFLQCFHYVGAISPMTWLTVDLLIIGPNFSPWLLCLKDLQDARMLSGFLQHLANLTNQSVSYEVLTNENAMCRFINNSLSILITTGHQPIDEIYFVSNESPATIHKKLLVNQAIKLWANLCTKQQIIHDDTFIVLEILIHILPLKTAETIVNMLTENVDTFTYQIIDWPLLHNRFERREDDESEDMRIREKLCSLIPSLQQSRRFAFLRQLMNRTCTSPVDGQCNCIVRFIENDYDSFLDILSESYHQFEDQIILHIDPAVCLDVIAARNEQFLEFHEAPLIRFGEPFEFRTTLLSASDEQESSGIDPGNSINWQTLTCYSGSDVRISFIDSSKIKPLEPFHENLLNLSHFLRTHGLGVPAATRLIDLCNYWKINTPSTEESFIRKSAALFLGDGLGSTSYAFLRHYENAVVMWNTKVDHGNPITPIATNDPSTSNRIMTNITRNLLEDDLLENQTIRTITGQFSHLSNLVFCDATVLEYESEKLYKIYENILLISMSCKPITTTGLCFLRTSIVAYKTVMKVLSNYSHQFFMIEFVRPRGCSHLNDLFIAIHIKVHVELDSNDQPTKNNHEGFNKDIFLAFNRYWKNMNDLLKLFRYPERYLNMVRSVYRESIPFWPEVPYCYDYIASTLTLQIDQIAQNQIDEICDIVRSTLQKYVTPLPDDSTIRHLIGSHESEMVRMNLNRLIPLASVCIGFLFMHRTIVNGFHLSEAATTITEALPQNVKYLFFINPVVNDWFLHIPTHYKRHSIMSFNKGLFLCMSLMGINMLFLNQPRQEEYVEEDDEFVQDFIL